MARQMTVQQGSNESLFRVPPFFFLHVLDGMKLYSLINFNDKQIQAGFLVGFS